MLLNPARFFFSFLTLTSVYVVLSTNTLLCAWIGLELNMMCFIPLMTSYKNFYQMNAALKYFLVQAFAAALILLSFVYSKLLMQFSTLIVFIALAIKMGAAPFHFWFPSVLQGTDWAPCWFLLTIQKISPLVLTSYFIYSEYMIMFLSISSAIVGALGGLNQTLIKKIMAYSSINHLSWMAVGLYADTTYLFFYIIIYIVIVTSLIMIFHSQQLIHISQVLSSFNLDTSMKLVILMSLLSLGGLPPFLGFAPKMILINLLITSNNIIWLIPLVLSALITLYFYLRISIPIVLMTSTKPRLNLKINNWMIFTMFLNLTPFLIPFTMFMPF